MNPGVELFESINVIVVSKGGTREPGEAKSSMRHNSTNKRLYKPNLSDIYDIETWSTSGQEQARMLNSGQGKCPDKISHDTHSEK